MLVAVRHKIFTAASSERHLLTNNHTVPISHSGNGLYKQINAPFGQLGMDTRNISTTALASGDGNDSAYTALTKQDFVLDRCADAIASEMKAMLDGAAFDDEVFDEVVGRHLIGPGN